MSIKEFAEKISGLEYPARELSEFHYEAKNSGYLIAYGMSDDLLELRGVIDDELGACDGRVTKVGTKNVRLEAVWCPESKPNSSWEIVIDCPHEVFTIMEGGEVFCFGVVVDCKYLDLSASEEREAIDRANGVLTAEDEAWQDVQSKVDEITTGKPTDPCVLVDLDGTLALTGHRLHYIQGDEKDWDKFFEACVDDQPNEAVIQVVRMLSISYPITVVTGRSSQVLEQTQAWLHRYGIPYRTLIMREHGDHTPDHELKKLWAAKYNWNSETVLSVIEDRDSVVKMWRSLGITCLQCAEGAF